MPSQTNVCGLCGVICCCVALSKCFRSCPSVRRRQEALKQPDAEEFLEAMVKEVEDHARREHWKIVTVSEMIASGCKGKPIMGAWSMKRKRNPLGVIAKHKARLCAHGGQTIEGVHCESAHAPVVTWTTIRFLLTPVSPHAKDWSSNLQRRTISQFSFSQFYEMQFL